MKRLLAFILLIFPLVAPPVFGAGPDSQYVRAYALIQEGDQFVRSGRQESARERYVEARAELRNLQTGFPNWNVSVIQFRLQYLSNRIAELGTVPSKEKDEPPSAIESDPEKEEIRRLQSENAVLESKLKEALTARPADVNPLELTQAEERIRLLEKEKELLRLALENEQAKRGDHGESAEIQRLNAALTQANTKVAEQAEFIASLRREKEILEARLHQAASRKSETVSEFRIESQEAKDQRAPVGSEPVRGSVSEEGPSPSNIADTKPGTERDSGEVAQLQRALTKLQEEKAALERIKADLEARLEIATSDPASQASRMRRVEDERDALLKKLNETTRQLYDNKARTEIVEREQYERQLGILRARLEVFEAREVPLSEEELALLKEPELALAMPEQRKGRSSPPKGAEPLALEAERAFSARRFDDAAEKFREILRLDPQSTYALANLATIDLQQNRLTEAEANLKRALGFDPRDTHSMTLMGILRFTQGRFDDALDFLGRAAQENPNDPQTQNYLGVTLSHKGQRGPAETALRRAIQIAPNYGGAHQNLAIIYATQQPPFKELARWHYQKSLATGHPSNPEVEKLIEGDPGAVRAE